jgi:hypothetical protein
MPTRFCPDVSMFMPKNGYFYVNYKNSRTAAFRSAPVAETNYLNSKNRWAKKQLGNSLAGFSQSNNVVTLAFRPINFDTQNALDKQAMDQLKVDLIDVASCPILLDRLSEPVITPSGNTYTSGAIYQSLERRKEDPLTREPCLARELRKNNIIIDIFSIINALEKAVGEDERKAHEESLLRRLRPNPERNSYFTNPVVDKKGNTIESKESDPAYKNRLLLEIMEIPFIKELIKKQKKESHQENVLTEMPIFRDIKPNHKKNSNFLSVVSNNLSGFFNVSTWERLLLLGSKKDRAATKKYHQEARLNVRC